MHFSCAAILLSSPGESQFPGNGRDRNRVDVTVPYVIRGQWFSREKNVNTYTTFDGNTMSGRGYLVEIGQEFHVNYTMIFRQDNCFHCVRIIVRTVNILEKIESKLL
jgi:hypothetical protein